MTYPALVPTPTPAPALVPTPAAPGAPWVTNTHPEYDECLPKWTYARDHYTGECASAAKVAAYLIRKKIGETTEAFEERVLLADYTPHFSAVVDTLAGMLANVEDDATRTWGKTAKGKASKKAGPLGDPKDPDTQIGRLFHDADGEGDGWLVLWQMLATDLVAVHEAWVMVDGNDGVHPRVRLIETEDVINWREEDEALVEAVVRVHADSRVPLSAGGGKCETQYLHLTTAGWQRYRIVKVDGKDQAVPVADAGASGTYEYVTRDRKPTIPLFCVELGLRRNVGFQMAKKANAIFNKESERDLLLRVACFPILNVHANDATFKKIVAQLREGARVLQVAPTGTAHSYAAPDAGPADTLNTAIDTKTQDFYATAFREFGAAARQGRDRVTAAEVKSDVAVGVAAFLAMLRAAVDGAENNALWLLEQTVFPGDPGKWGLAKAERSHDFVPYDVNATIERLRLRYFGQNGVVPVGPTALAAVVKEIASWDGIEVVDAEVEKAVKPAPPPAQPAPAGGVARPGMPGDMPPEPPAPAK